MFQYSKFEDREAEAAISENSSNSGVPATIKQKIKSVLRSKPIHIVIIVLIILDSIFVLTELLIDVKLLDFGEESPVPSIFHGFSIAILSTFMVEITLKIYVDPVHFFSHKIEILDAIVVVVSFVVDIVLAVVEEVEVLGVLSFLVLLRLVRITNGIVVTAKAKADERVHALKQERKQLIEKLEKAEAVIKSQHTDISAMTELLDKNGIKYNNTSSPSKADESKLRLEPVTSGTSLSRKVASDA